MNLLDRDQHFAAGARRDVALEFVNLRSLATDNDARSRGVDDDLQTIGGPLDIDVRNAGAGKTLFQIALQLEILDQKITELLLRKPVRMPVLVVAEAKAVGMNFLAQSLLQSQICDASNFGTLNLEFGILNLEFKTSYSSVFFLRRKALPSFAAALLALFFGFSSAAVVLFSAGAASALTGRFARGAAAAPPRLARLLTAGFTSPVLPLVAAASCWSLETRIVT